MTERTTILVPLDGSTQAEQALPLALRIAAQGGELILLRVRSGPESFDDFWASERLPAADREAAADAAIRSSLAPLAESAKAAGIPVRIEVAGGDPTQEIIRLAEAEQVDLIVMTTRGRGALDRAVFGSVADRIVHHGTRPTLIVRVDTAGTLPDRVVVPLDRSPVAEQALPVAAWVAERLGVPVHLVHVVVLAEIIEEIERTSPPDRRVAPAPDAYDRARARSEAAAAGYLAGHAQRLQERGISVSTDVRTGTPVFVLLELLRPGDLAVMTTRGLGGFGRLWIGSVADKLVRQAAAPVLLVRAEPPTETETADHIS